MSAPPARRQSPPRRRRACASCAKARVRCDYETGDSCNRCQQMQLSCIPPATQSLRKPRQVKPKEKSNTAHVSTAPTRGRRQNLLAHSRDTPTNSASNAGPVASSSSLEQRAYNIPFHPRSLPLKSSNPNHPPPSPGFGISWEQAEKALVEFTNLFKAHFPFVILEHDITARRLCTEKPLLFRVILMIATDFTASKSRELRRSVDAWIGQHMLVMEEQDIGVLQGLLVYILWTSPQFYSDHRATQLLYLAIGLAHSLGITRETVPGNEKARKESEINEEHRAFLACYYITSFNSLQFCRPNPLSDSYVQHCIDSLERSSEFATDFLLLKLVKFRQLIGRVPSVYQGICDGNWCREISEDASDELRKITKELDDSMCDIASNHPKLLLLWNLHNSAIVQLHLPMTYIAPKNETVCRIQLECMQHCLRAARAFVSRVMSFSPDAMLYAPFTTLADVMFMLIASSRLLVVCIEGWDLKEARRAMNLKPVLMELKNKLTAASKVRAARLAEAAMANPSSYKPDGPDDDKHNRIHVSIKMVECIEIWLDSQGCFLSSDEPSQSQEGGADKTQSPVPDFASPQSPLWDFTYYFGSLVGVDRALAS
ncbi:hypothetical protein F5B22DRAFT_616878 [Xylaria bambusicola]|uniref:uncharacterized protein n=1 Tax=Xylaria bambusicola TaxID=326684 RepID=UPI0020087B38|nr:uncharacterized protein F5B22DRAFT_616878 [Xylaria bambusicola]KAI0509389.1 hypothetical protein F5B22DRAFT_616878 [Xylaria bambusicola]